MMSFHFLRNHLSLLCDTHGLILTPLETELKGLWDHLPSSINEDIKAQRVWENF